MATKKKQTMTETAPAPPPPAEKGSFLSPKEAPGRPGPISLFRDKIVTPISWTATKEVHDKMNLNMKRLDLSRADLLGLLVMRYADVVGLPAAGDLQTQQAPAPIAQSAPIEQAADRAPRRRRLAAKVAKRTAQVATS